MEKGRLNLIGAGQTEPDEESHFITGPTSYSAMRNYNRTAGSSKLAMQPVLKRNNSNLNKPNRADLSIED